MIGSCCQQLDDREHGDGVGDVVQESGEDGREPNEDLNGGNLEL